MITKLHSTDRFLLEQAYLQTQLYNDPQQYTYLNEGWREKGMDFIAALKSPVFVARYATLWPRIKMWGIEKLLESIPWVLAYSFDSEGWGLFSKAAEKIKNAANTPLAAAAKRAAEEATKKAAEVAINPAVQGPGDQAQALVDKATEVANQANNAMQSGSSFTSPNMMAVSIFVAICLYYTSRKQYTRAFVALLCCTPGLDQEAQLAVLGCATGTVLLAKILSHIASLDDVNDLYENRLDAGIYNKIIIKFKQPLVDLIQKKLPLWAQKLLLWALNFILANPNRHPEQSQQSQQSQQPQQPQLPASPQQPQQLQLPASPQRPPT